MHKNRIERGAEQGERENEREAIVSRLGGVNPAVVQ